MNLHLIDGRLAVHRMAVVRQVVRLDILMIVLAWVPSRAVAADNLVESRLRPGQSQIELELFVRGDSDQCTRASDFLQRLEARRSGVRVTTHDVMQDREALGRLWKLARRFQYDRPGVPAIYVFDRLQMGFRDAQTTGRQIESLLTIRAFVREGCGHCRDAKRFLAELTVRWPGIRVELYDAVRDASSRAMWTELSRKHQVRVPVLPSFDFAGRYVVGFQTASTTGRQLEDILRSSRSAPRRPQPSPSKDATEAIPIRSSRVGRRSPWIDSTRFVSADNRDPQPALFASVGGIVASNYRATAKGWRFVAMAPNRVALRDRGGPADESVASDDEALPDESRPPDELALPDELPLPDEVPLPDGIPEAVRSDADGNAAPGDTIEVPFLGVLRVREMGLPTFTFLIGLVDGFNPCAMWVLVFLLTVLVNIRSRKKMIAIAGTFVVVSGLAYFAFMAAWLNVFQLLGMQRPLQIALGSVAVLIGAINIKDFFAFHQGVSLSIPESAKPGIYRRVRQIVSAQYLSAAMAGAVVLAVIVNVVELLCTAGLPALYTQVLYMHELPAWQNYGYLALYNLAYMLDDSILLAIVVVTLSHRRLQEKEGRWLKLISGVVILLLGLAMLWNPEWLSWS